MLYPIIIVGSLITGYYCSNYFTNITSTIYTMSDKLYDNHTIKCSNKLCNKIHKLINDDAIVMTKKFYCNTVCEYISYNNEQEDFVKLHKYTC